MGPAAVALFFVRLAASRLRPARIALRTLNGFPAAVIDFESPRGRRPPRLALSVDVDAQGRIRVLRAIAISRKLSALRTPLGAA